MDRLHLPEPWNAVLGRAGRLAHHARGGEDSVAVYVSSGTALHRQPVDDPTLKLCGLWMRIAPRLVLSL